MKTFEQKVHDIALEVGGSHYPNVNANLHEQMVKAVIDECITAIDKADRSHVYTTFDKAQHEAAIERVKQSIKESFGL